MAKKPCRKELTVRVSRDGTLVIEIGLETLARAAAHSPIVNDVTRGRLSPEVTIRPLKAFAKDVVHELKDELGEDGSTLVTRMFDEAFRKIYENGSEHFVIEGDEQV